MATSAQKPSLRELYTPGEVARCPHCNRDSRLLPLAGRAYTRGNSYEGVVEFGIAATRNVIVWGAGCSLCNQAIVGITIADCPWAGEPTFERLVWPPGAARAVPPEVPDTMTKDLREACEVLHISPNASVVLSRRCLQALLRATGWTTAKDLAEQIQDVLDAKRLPPELADELDAVRNIGLFGAHPKKSQTSGEIVDAKPGEAEWNLDVLEDLFDFCYVQPKKRAERKAALDQKLADIGKPPMKQPPTTEAGTG